MSLRHPRLPRFFAAVLSLAGATLAVGAASTACSPTLAQPFYSMKGQPITIYRLQNFEPPAAQAAVPGLPGVPGLPPQIQQWMTSAAAALPPGLLPPGLLPGSAAAPGAADSARFYGFRVLGTASVNDTKLHDEILELFGKEGNWKAPTQSCMYAEFGFQMGQAAASTIQGAPSSAPPADVLVSLSCDVVDMKNYAWPHTGKTGIGSDTSAKVVSIVRRAFGG